MHPWDTFCEMLIPNEEREQATKYVNNLGKMLDLQWKI